MQFIREKMTGHFVNKADGRLFTELGDSFKPIIYGATQELYKLLPGVVDERKIQGDFFFNTHNDMFYYYFSPELDSITAGAVCNSIRARIDWHKFRDALTKAVGGGTWKNDTAASEQFIALHEETVPLMISDWERKAAIALQRPNLRSMMKLISSRPSVSLQEVAEDRELFEVSEDVQLLESLGMITREFEIYCADTNQKISCVSNLSALEEAAKRGFKCFHCGRPISDEKIVQSLSITDSGCRIAAKNMWLAYLVGASLCDEGVEPDHIMARSEHNADIVEIFADVKGSLMMFSVSESELTADVAFRFITRSRFFCPEWGYLVTPNKVSADVRTVVASTGDRLAIVEGLDKLPEVVRQGVAKASDKVLCDLLQKFNQYTQLDIGSWVSDYMDNNEDIEAIIGNIDTDVDLNLPALDEPAAGGESGGTEELTQTEDENGGEAEPAAQPETADNRTPDAEPLAEDSKIRKNGRNARDKKNHDIPEKTGFGSVIESVLTLLPAAYENSDSEVDVNAQIDAVNAQINSVAGMDGCSIMIATSDGRPLLGDLSTVEDSDLVAAAQVELMQNVSNTLADNDLGTLQNVVLCSAGNTMRVYLSVDDLTVITHQKESEIDDIVIKHSKSSPNLRRALKGLVALPGVAKTMLMTADGESLGSIGFTSDKDLAPCFAYMMRDVINVFCEDVGLGRIRACAVRTDKSLFQVMCLGEAYYLVSELGTKVPEYVWRRDLPAEASFVSANV